MKDRIKTAALIILIIIYGIFAVLKSNKDYWADFPRDIREQIRIEQMTQ